MNRFNHYMKTFLKHPSKTCFDHLEHDDIDNELLGRFATYQAKCAHVGLDSKKSLIAYQTATQYFTGIKSDSSFNCKVSLDISLFILMPIGILLTVILLFTTCCPSCCSSGRKEIKEEGEADEVKEEGEDKEMMNDETRERNEE